MTQRSENEKKKILMLPSVRLFLNIVFIFNATAKH